MSEHTYNPKIYGIVDSFIINAERGVQGTQGFQGVQGSNGAGSQGVQGTQGFQGVQGIQGTIGSGLQGAQGIQGIAGTSSSGSSDLYLFVWENFPTTLPDTIHLDTGVITQDIRAGYNINIPTGYYVAYYEFKCIQTSDVASPMITISNTDIHAPLAFDIDNGSLVIIYPNTNSFSVNSWPTSISLFNQYYNSGDQVRFVVTLRKAKMLTTIPANAPTFNYILRTLNKDNSATITVSYNPGNVATTLTFTYDIDSEYGDDPQVTSYAGTGNESVIESITIPASFTAIFSTIYVKIDIVNSVGSDSVNTSYVNPVGANWGTDSYVNDISTFISSLTGSDVYIDTSAPTNGTGSLASPYNTFSGLLFGSNRKYYIKRGTQATFATGFNTINGVCSISDYGDPALAKPIILCTGASSYFIQSSYKILINNIDLRCSYQDANLRYVGVAIRLRNSAGSIIHNCNIQGWGQGILLSPINGTNANSWAGATIAYNTIHSIDTDGIYVDDVTDVNIGYNYIHDVNLSYSYSTNDTISAGDGIQIAFAEKEVDSDYLRFNIHHNTIDRTTGGNKFCIIVGAGPYNRYAVGRINDNYLLINTNNENAIYFDTILQGAIWVNNNRIKGEGTGAGIHNRVNTGIGDYFTVYENVFENLGVGIDNQTGNCTFVKNSFINCTYCYTLYTTSGSIFNNHNAFISDSSTDRLIGGNEYAKLLESEDNLYFMPTILTSYPTLEDFKTLTSMDVLSISTDPSLMFDYSPLSNSVVIANQQGAYYQLNPSVNIY